MKTTVKMHRAKRFFRHEIRHTGRRKNCVVVRRINQCGQKAFQWDKNGYYQIHLVLSSVHQRVSNHTPDKWKLIDGNVVYFPHGISDIIAYLDIGQELFIEKKIWIFCSPFLWFSWVSKFINYKLNDSAFFIWVRNFVSIFLTSDFCSVQFLFSSQAIISFEELQHEKLSRLSISIKTVWII